MSQGKFSPKLPHCNDDTAFDRNCYGKEVTPMEDGVPYDVKTMFGNFDDEGYDGYGYSCFGRDGEWVGIGEGVDRLGYTEMEYLCMSQDDFWCIADNAYRC